MMFKFRNFLLFWKILFLGWIPVKKEVEIPLDLESRSLEIKANSKLGSTQTVGVLFSTYGYDLGFRGRLSITFNYSYYQPAELYLVVDLDYRICTDRLEIYPPRSAGMEREQVFKIARISGDKPRIQLQWNGKLVANVNITLLSEQCYNGRNPGRADIWRKPMDVIKFSYDDAAEYYRLSKACNFCVILGPFHCRDGSAA